MYTTPCTRKIGFNDGQWLTHAAEHLTNIRSRLLRDRLAHGTLGVDVDKTNGRLAQRVLTLAIDRARELDLLFGARTKELAILPIRVVETAGTETEHGAAHGLDGDITREDNEVTPGQTGAILLLDRPQQVTGLMTSEKDTDKNIRCKGTLDSAVDKARLVQRSDNITLR